MSSSSTYGRGDSVNYAKAAIIAYTAPQKEQVLQSFRPAYLWMAASKPTTSPPFRLLIGTVPRALYKPQDYSEVAAQVIETCGTLARRDLHFNPVAMLLMKPGLGLSPGSAHHQPDLRFGYFSDNSAVAARILRFASPHNGAIKAEPMAATPPRSFSALAGC